MESGALLILLNNKNILDIYLNSGIYGFLTKISSCVPNSKNKFYAILSDYACTRKGTRIFFVCERNIYYGGKIEFTPEIPAFYVNGKNTDIGMRCNAKLVWDESTIVGHEPTEEEGVFIIDDVKKCQPFIIRFYDDGDVGKYISTDEYYYEIGGVHSYPLPSNSMSGTGFCTLTPFEINILNRMISQSNNRIKKDHSKIIPLNNEPTIFDIQNVNFEHYISESQLEFRIIASFESIGLFNKEYILCRQVPISPFKPSRMDLADICLYDKSDLINDGSIPNVIIELKKGKANGSAYKQVDRYLDWLEKITESTDYKKIKAYIIAESFVRKPLGLNHEDKIVCQLIDDIFRNV